ncbi:MAG: nitroreductase family protein [Candidatus Peribacteraceae bacterium]|nr:nitroreductase family protein [Candidatus Peribacteraceae bacterium]
MTYDDFHTLCNQRRSIRYFSDEPVTTEEIEKVIEIANMSPSVQNTQPWHFHIIKNAQMRKKLMETSCYGNFIEGASVFIIVACDRTARPDNQEIIWNPKELEYSCACAAEHLLLAATTLKLGSCWVSLHHGKSHDILKLQDSHIVIGGLMLGHYKPGEEEPSSGHVRKDPHDTFTIYE